MQSLLNRIWYGSSPLWLKPLTPFLAAGSMGYRFGLNRDRHRKEGARKSLPRPVLSVGNLSVGGTGKTPVVRFLAEAAVSFGLKPAILSRGYGSKSRTPTRVEARAKDWRAFGDEAVLLSRQLPETPIWVGPDRYDSGCAALEEDASIDLFLLDDGFQHVQLGRDFDLVLVDGKRGLGNGKIIPWGPLREPQGALDRADCIGVIHKSGGESGWAPPSSIASKTLSLDLGPVGWNYLGEEEIRDLETLPRDHPAIAVTGIGSPDSFEDTLREVGLKVESRHDFGDHHEFTVGDLEPIFSGVGGTSGRIITTLKDAVRMEDLRLEWTESTRPIIIQISVKTGDGAIRLIEILKSFLNHREKTEIKVSGGGTST